jgi:hypothetical protein
MIFSGFGLKFGSDQIRIHSTGFELERCTHRSIKYDTSTVWLLCRTVFPKPLL